MVREGKEHRKMSWTGEGQKSRNKRRKLAGTRCDSAEHVILSKYPSSSVDFEAGGVM